MNKNAFILWVLWVVIPGMSFSQQSEINNMFDELQQNMDVGAIVRQAKNETSIVVTRKYFTSILKNGTILDYDSVNISPFVRDITKGYRIGMRVEVVIDPVSANIDAQFGKSRKRLLTVLKGHEKITATGDIAKIELLNMLDLNYLDKINNAIKKKEKIHFITRVFYVDSGYIEIVDDKKPSITAKVKMDSVGGDVNYGKTNKDSLKRTYNPNTAVAYNGILITKKEVEQIIRRKKNPNGYSGNFSAMPFGIHQFMNKQPGKGILFLVTETGLLGAGSGYCISAYRDLNKHKNDVYDHWERDRFYGKYKNRLRMSGWLFAGAATVAVLNYCDNFNWFRKSSVAFVPATVFNWQGQLQLAMTVSTNF